MLELLSLFGVPTAGRAHTIDHEAEVLHLAETLGTHQWQTSSYLKLLVTRRRPQ